METKISIKKPLKKNGQFVNIEDAIRFKNDELTQILKNIDFNKASSKK